MVRLHTSLLAVTLAMSPALASSYEFQRREVGNRVPSRGPLSIRLGDAAGRFHAFDDLEAREPGAAAGMAVKDFAKMAGNLALKHGGKAVNFAGGIASVAAFGLALKPPPKPSAPQPQSRGLEDEEDLLLRDLDAEELFGREYVLLDERDITFDDLD